MTSTLLHRHRNKTVMATRAHMRELREADYNPGEVDSDLYADADTDTEAEAEAADRNNAATVITDDGDPQQEHQHQGWGYFDALVEKKHRLESECDAMTARVRAIMLDTPGELPLAAESTKLIADATDHYIEQLQKFLDAKLGWTGMSLRHTCPVCRSRMDNRPTALTCGHVFCGNCPEDFMVTFDDEDIGEERDEYTCPLCRKVSEETITLYL